MYEDFVRESLRVLDRNLDDFEVAYQHIRKSIQDVAYYGSFSDDVEIVSKTAGLALMLEEIGQSIESFKSGVNGVDHELIENESFQDRRILGGEKDVHDKTGNRKDRIHRDRKTRRFSREVKFSRTVGR